MSFTKPLSGYRKIQTRRGDTLQAVALRELGDAAQWYDLANINGLLPPYLTDDPAVVSDRVLLTGSELLVPAAPPAATGVADQESVFGSDIALRGRQLQVDEGGDIAIVSGVPNLEQALQHRLETVPGELLFHPTYGCEVYALLGRKGGPATNQLAATFASRALRADPRVAKLNGTTAVIVGDAVRISSEAITVDGKTIPVGVSRGLPG